MYARIWYEPTGEVKVTTFSLAATEEDRMTACQTLLVDGRVSPGATWDDVGDADELKRLLPSDRSARHQWRKNPSGRGCRVDPQVPMPPHPRQKLLDAIEAAKDLNELKTLLARSVKGDPE